MNRLNGRLSRIETQGSIALVDVEVGDQVLTATLIGFPPQLPTWPVGTELTLIFKETEVSLGKHLCGLLSLRNRLPCVIVGLEVGRLLTRVLLKFGPEATIESIITTRSATRLALVVGDEVEALVKANEMTLLLDGVP